MFVKSIKVMGATALSTAILVLGFGVPANAADYEAKDKGTIPLTISIANVQSGTTPLYISVQKRGEYQGIKGFGEILKTTTSGVMATTVKVDAPGEYAVSLWHDLNNDGVFSMTKSYKILDGWGASGNVPKHRAPVFDDVKISVPSAGQSVSVDMIYPS